MFAWLNQYRILNLRCILRSLAILINVVLVIELLTELFDPFDGILADSRNQRDTFCGSDCEECLGRPFRLPADVWTIYIKVLSVFFNLWLLSHLSVVFFPLFWGNWLFEHQEELYTFRSNIVIISVFNIFPLIMLGSHECEYARYFFLIAPMLIFTAVLSDRIFVRANDYFQLADYGVVAQGQWQEDVQWENVESHHENPPKE
uniref:Transmembrane protein n=1 Tax=Panagrolaimus superbus TaxID=310955 RepID=A0A914ZAL4_9BILA